MSGEQEKLPEAAVLLFSIYVYLTPRAQPQSSRAVPPPVLPGVRHFLWLLMRSP